MILTLEQFKNFIPKKPTYALFGYPIEHTMSPQLHSYLFDISCTDADYIAVEVMPNELEEALKIAKLKLKGINITIPHKKEIIKFLDDIDLDAKFLNSVNTIKFENKKAIGYNTDIIGFSKTLEKDEIKLKNTKVLIIGYGGVSSVIAYYCAKSKAKVYITGRSIEKAYKLKNEIKENIQYANITVCTRKQIPKDIQIVINGTSLGMYPHEEKIPLYFLPRKTNYVFDAIYNPPKTSTMKLARKNIRTRNGIYMLVVQAATAQTIWNETVFEQTTLESISRKVLARLSAKRLKDKHNKDNLVLCGFMGSGKTTIGKKLARLMGFKHIDVDIYLEEKEGKTISNIFSQYGENEFRRLETKYIKEICQMKNVVISLGGGAVIREENIYQIKSNGYLIYLDTPFHRIIKNLEYSSNRPLIDKKIDKISEIRKLYNNRKHIYHDVSDCSVRSSRLSELVEDLFKSI